MDEGAATGGRPRSRRGAGRDGAVAAVEALGLGLEALDESVGERDAPDLVVGLQSTHGHQVNSERHRESLVSLAKVP